MGAGTRGRDGRKGAGGHRDVAGAVGAGDWRGGGDAARMAADKCKWVGIGGVWGLYALTMRVLWGLEAVWRGLDRGIVPVPCLRHTCTHALS